MMLVKLMAASVSSKIRSLVDMYARSCFLKSNVTSSLNKWIKHAFNYNKQFTQYYHYSWPMRSRLVFKYCSLCLLAGALIGTFSTISKP